MGKYLLTQQASILKAKPVSGSNPEEWDHWEHFELSQIIYSFFHCFLHPSDYHRNGVHWY